MKVNTQVAMENMRRKACIVRLLKMMLLALKLSEGFGKDRLMRVLYTWSNLEKEAKGRNVEDMMHEVDMVLEHVLPKSTMDTIGYEPLRDDKGNPINFWSDIK